MESDDHGMREETEYMGFKDVIQAEFDTIVWECVEEYVIEALRKEEVPQLEAI